MMYHVGTKFVEAREMTRGEYSKYRGWGIPDGKPADEGYLVKYSDEHIDWISKNIYV